MTFIKINDIIYPATISGRVSDNDWDKRESKSINLEMGYATASKLFVDGVTWSIVEQHEVPTYAEDGSYAYDEDGNQVMEMQETVFDNSEYSLAGDITDHRDGTITVKMGKLTDLEKAYEIMLGGM